MFGLEYFGFAAIWSPYLLGFMAILVGLYFLTIGRWRKQFADSEQVSFKKQFSFVAGMVLLYFAFGGPLNLLGHLTFTGHMVSMSVSYLLAPPLILYGIPAWLIRPITQDSWFAYFKPLLHPIITVLTFNALFSFYHLPQIHDFVMTHYIVHSLVYIVLLIAAFMMWWPVIEPVPEMKTLTDLKKMGYIFLNGVLLTPACALIIFSPLPLFETFTDPQAWAETMAFCLPGGSTAVLNQFSGPGFFGSLSIIDDQQLGGVIMKLFQEVIYGAILFYIFTQWYRNESQDDPLPEDDNGNDELLEGSLNRA